MVAIGAITLHPHQTAAVYRIRALIERNGGALLCDAVGLGKTYTALVVAAAYDRPLIVAPAALREMWHDAVAATGIKAAFVSHEALSRGVRLPQNHSFVVVDEAHHLRNRGTIRYAAVARLCATAPVLLLSATPIHNSQRDIAALAALFIGHRAHATDLKQLARLVVRRSGKSIAGAAATPLMPQIEHAPWRTLNTDDRVLDAIAALPPAVPASDGGIASALLTLGLARQLVSSSAALLAALRRRMAASHGLIASLEAGRYPTAADLRRWVLGDDALQLAFPELLSPSAAATVDLLDCVRAHLSGVEKLARSLAGTPPASGSDRERVDFVAGVMRGHPGEKLVVFSAYRETATMLYRGLVRLGGVALMNSRGGTVAGGPLTRRQVLAQFAPRASTTPAPTASDEISVLVTTDLLSEGVNLQRASVAINMDLPWTAARLEQRTGRIARLGSPHAVVTSYSVRPSPHAEKLLRQVSTIARKAGTAATLLGATAVSPGLGDAAPPDGHVLAAELVRATLERWLNSESANALPATFTPCGIPPPCVAAVRSCTDRAVVACVVDGTPQLLAIDCDGTVTTDPTHLLETLCDGEAAEAVADAAYFELVRGAALRWYEHTRAAIDAGLDGATTTVNASPLVRAAVRRANVAGPDPAFTRRGEWARGMSEIFAAASRPMPIALEEEIFGQAPSAALRAAGHVLRGTSAVAASDGLRLVAMLLLTCSSTSRDGPKPAHGKPWTLVPAPLLGEQHSCNSVSGSSPVAQEYRRSPPARTSYSPSLRRP